MHLGTRPLGPKLPFILLLAISWIAPGAARGADDRASLDIHVHLQQGITNDLEDSGIVPVKGLGFPWETPGSVLQEQVDWMLAHAGVQKFALISDGYLTEDVASSDEVNRATARMVAQHPDRLVGICGTKLAWEDAPESMARCLALPGMRGIKLHFFNQHVTLSTDPAARERLRAIARRVSPFRPFFLIHFNMDWFHPQHNFTEFEELIRIADDFPNCRFVIAHSATDSVPEVLVAIGRHYREHPERTRNIYAETSTSLISGVTHVAWQTHDRTLAAARYAAAWRELGIDRVLFGSDSMTESSRFDQELKSIETSPALTPAEKEAILFRNGERFFAE